MFNFASMLPGMAGQAGSAMASSPMGGTGSKMVKKPGEEEVAPVVDVSNLEAIQKLRRPYSGQNYMNLGGGQF